MPRILLSLAPEAEPRERLLTIDEAKALFAAATATHQILYLMLAFATAARPAALLELTTFQVDCDARLIRLNPAGRAQNKKRRPTIPICDALLPWLRGLPAGPVVQYRGKALTRTKMIFEHLAARAARRNPPGGDHGCPNASARRPARRGLGAIEDGRRRSAAIMEVTAYTIRRTVAAEMRKRGVPVGRSPGFSAIPRVTGRRNATQNSARITSQGQFVPSTAISRIWASLPFRSARPGPCVLAAC